MRDLAEVLHRLSAAARPTHDLAERAARSLEVVRQPGKTDGVSAGGLRQLRELLGM